ncbi:MAG: carbon monoxide dehydrogenase, partial [Oscillospiraceae bacterium]|nr:carbon monoxide dehydrogenase [Oscillospiraceae bacterium]
EPLGAGFSVEAIRYMLGGTYRASFRPLNDAIIQNRIPGVVGIVGCNTTRQQTDGYINTLTKELIKRNILVLQTGCAAIASGKAGMLRPEAALSEAGESLREVCEAVGIPPVLHMGSCVDNTRILEAAVEILREGGLGDDLGGLPAVGVAPEWMSEKAIAIGCYFVASGVDVFLGNPFFTAGGKNVHEYLHGGAKEDFGACFHSCADPLEAAERITDIIRAARAALGIDRKAERKLFDMKDRRDMG